MFKRLLTLCAAAVMTLCSYANTELTAEMFCRWDGFGADAAVVGTNAGEYHIGESSGLPYGHGNVEGSAFADLTAWLELRLTVTEGTPRLLLNRQGMDNSGDFIEINNEGSPYVASVENGVWTIDLAKIVAEAGYAHLNCIKGANWQNCTITKAVLVEVKTGHYYMQDAATGQFLGGANSWGTKASLIPAGQQLFIAPMADSDGYVIDTQISNGGESHFLGDNGYVDAMPKAYTFSLCKDGTYTVADGDNYLTHEVVNGENQVNWVADAEGAIHWNLLTAEDILATIGGTPEQPIDITSLILDPNMGRNNTLFNDAWLGDKPGKGGKVENFNAEKWGGNSQEFDSYQILSGLPMGLYRLTAQGYYRYNNTDENTNQVAIDAHADGTEEINSFLYANDAQVALKSIADDEAAEALAELPFSQNAASDAFAQGLYQNTLDVVVRNGELKFGVKKTSHPGCDWTVWDNFQLAYVGLVPAEIADGNYIFQNAETGLFLGGAYSWGTQASCVETPSFMTIEAAEGGYTIDTHVYNSDVQHYLGTNGYVDSNAAAYAIYEVAKGQYAIKSGDNYLAYKNEDGKLLAQWCTTEITNAATWTLISANEAMEMAIESSPIEPIDMTAYVQDANFSRNNRGFDAWQGDKPGKGGANENMNAEKWGGNSQEFDTYQLISGLPNGTYTVTMQGFYRYNNTDANTTDVAIAAHADGTEAIYSFLYANDAETPLCSIADDEASAALDGNLPFSQGAAGEAFAQGLYNNTLTCEVTDGTLRIGVKKTQHIGCDWTVWDNIRLYYSGKIVNLYEGLNKLGDVAADNGAYTYFTYTAEKSGRICVTTYGPDFEDMAYANPSGAWMGVEDIDAICIRSYGIPVAAGQEVIFRALVGKPGNLGYTMIGINEEDADGADHVHNHFADADAIATVEAANNNAAIYNIAGQRINRLQKGINIVAGKKIIK